MGHHRRLQNQFRPFFFFFFFLFSTALWDLANSRPVHSLMLSSHLFCLPCLLSSFTVPCKMVLARLDKRQTRPYHFSLRLFTIVRSSYGPIAGWILARTSSLVTWSLYEMPGRTSPTVPANVQVHILCPIEEIHNCCLITNFILSIMRITSGIC